MRHVSPDLEEVFSEALARPLDERAEYVAMACGSNEQMRRRVMVLLAAHESAGSFLQLPEELPPVVPTEVAGTVIGNYTVVRALGEGGFGVVYLADQSRPIRRQVALKVIKLGMDTRQVIRRFEAERQALARMDHPNIAKVFDAGTTEQGRPYFVMELATGVPITQYCDDQRLTIRERLELFVQVCEGVQHAHQKGIIHRDIKPSNVIVTLLDGKPVPKIIDFGIAKATQGKLTEQTMVTEVRQFMGTPAYMSPEQTKPDDGDIDTRSDVYSLGVLLYQLLAGATPFSAEELAAGKTTIHQLICETDPPRPSARFERMTEDQRRAVAAGQRSEPGQHARELHGDLDWIVMKCLEKDRSRRYETALGLARDLERYMADEPVEALPPSAAYVMKKFMRRHRLPLQMAAAGACILIAALGVSIWQAVRATRAEREMSIAQKNTAAAEHEAVMALADMYMSRGLESTTSSRNGQSLLWFANAAILAKNDPARVKANLIRFKNWSRTQWEPVAAVESPGSDRISINPVSPRYLLTDVRDSSQLHARFWNLETEKPLELPAEWGNILSGAWGADGRAAAGSDKGTVALLKFPALEAVKTWSIEKPVTRVALNARADVIAAAAEDEVFLWRIRSSAAPAKVRVSGDIRYLQFSDSGNFLLTADASRRAHLFALNASGDALLMSQVLSVRHELQNDPFTFPPVLTAGERELMVVEDAGTRDKAGIVRWYSTTTRAQVAQYSENGLWTTRRLVPTADGNYVAMTGGEGRLVDSRTHTAVQAIGDINIAAFHPRSPLLISADPSTIFPREFASGRMGNLVLPELRPPAGGNEISLSGDGQLLAVLQGGVAQVWKVPAGVTVQSHTIPANGTATWTTLSADGKYVAPTGIMDGNGDVRLLQVFETENGKPAGAALALDGTLMSAGFSRSGEWIAVASGMKDDPKNLRIWDWRQGKDLVAPISLESEPVWLAVAPDDKAVAVQCIDGKLLMIDPATGGTLWARQCAAVRQLGGGDSPYPYFISLRGSIQFSHDGKKLFTAGSPVVEAWDRARGDRLYEIRHEANSWAMAESPDGRILATGSEDRKLRFADAATGELIASPILHSRAVGGIEFSPDGERFCTSSYDGETRIWETRTRKLLHIMPSPAKLNAARFTFDGTRILETSFARFRILDASTGHPLTPVFGAAGFHSHIALTPDDRWASIAGVIRLPAGSKYNPGIFDVRDLSTPFAGTVDDAAVLAEILSCGRLNGSTFVRLNNAEWLERWEKHHAKDPKPYAF